MQKQQDQRSKKSNLRRLFVEKIDRKIKKLEQPVDKQTYYDIVSVSINNFNVNCSALFINKKYSEYLMIFEYLQINSKQKFLIYPTFDLNIFSSRNTDLRYYLDRGWSNSEACLKLKKRQSTLSIDESLDYALLEKAKDKRSLTINKQKLSRKNNTEFQIYLKTAFPNTLEYWLRKINPQTDVFYTIGEAKTEVLKVQKQNSIKSTASKRRRNSFNSCRSIKGWLNRGFSIEHALAAVHEIQSTNTFIKYIEKYGLSIGPLKFRERQEKRLKTLSGKTDLEKMDLVLRQSVGFKKYSNASLVFFKNLIAYIETVLRITDLTYYYGEDEIFIYDKIHKKIRFYDFYIKELAYYIEFNGIKYHPNKLKLSDADWKQWHNPFSKITADEQFKIDQTKANLITESGGELYVFWEQDCVYETYINLGNIIKQKYYIYKKMLSNDQSNINY
jgi:hypothetical protein